MFVFKMHRGKSSPLNITQGLDAITVNPRISARGAYFKIRRRRRTLIRQEVGEGGGVGLINFFSNRGMTRSFFYNLSAYKQQQKLFMDKKS